MGLNAVKCSNLADKAQCYCDVIVNQYTITVYTISGATPETWEGDTGCGAQHCQASVTIISFAPIHM